jgi:hypothetical protein
VALADRIGRRLAQQVRIVDQAVEREARDVLDGSQVGGRAGDVARFGRLALITAAAADASGVKYF